ncbi:hypothetical protein PVK06_004841 [Gossypium arboreum]|uniref:Uncharacterized protein n=1 Tax=Gossypium arboreum TaxID=29729 RepID=A0ABR0QUB5_GOSAR|nr:hypothetical protein PVK06_004841 [Gossypium arboreum]
MGQGQGSGSTSLLCKNRMRKQKQQKEEGECSPSICKGRASIYYSSKLFPPFTKIPKDQWFDSNKKGKRARKKKFWDADFDEKRRGILVIVGKRCGKRLGVFNRGTKQGKGLE